MKKKEDQGNKPRANWGTLLRKRVLNSFLKTHLQDVWEKYVPYKLAEYIQTNNGLIDRFNQFNILVVNFLTKQSILINTRGW